MVQALCNALDHWHGSQNEIVDQSTLMYLDFCDKCLLYNFFVLCISCLKSDLLLSLFCGLFWQKQICPNCAVFDVWGLTEINNIYYQRFKDKHLLWNMGWRTFYLSKFQMIVGRYCKKINSIFFPIKAHNSHS